MPETLLIKPGGLETKVNVLRLSGRLEATGAQRLRQQCLELRGQGMLRLILELSGLTFVASSGLGTFLLLTEEFGNAGGKVVLAALNPNVLSVIKLLNLDKFLIIEDSLDQALAVAKK
jgi:anti-sigma B factor antagonist